MQQTINYIELNSLEELHFRLYLQCEDELWDELASIWNPEDDKHIQAIMAVIDNGHSVEILDGSEEFARHLEDNFPKSVYLLNHHIGKLVNFFIFTDDNQYGTVYFSHRENHVDPRVFSAPRHPYPKEK